MRGVTRSFWILSGILGVLEGYLLYLALASLHQVLPCWWSFIPHPNSALAGCGESVAIFGYLSWVPGAVILALFAATMAAAASTLLSQWIKTRRAIRDFVLLFDQPPALCEAESVIGARVDLVEDDRCFCCCAGAVRPRIYISTGMVQKLSATEVVAVLAHEREHARKRDPVRAAATRIAARALFYVPLARHLAEKSLVDSELGADSSAVSRVGREPLVSALLQVLGEARPVLGGATEMASLDALDLRIETLRTRSLPPVRPSLTVIVGTVIAVGAMWGLLLWLPPTVKGAEIGHTHITAHHRSPGKQ